MDIRRQQSIFGGIPEKGMVRISITGFDEKQEHAKCNRPTHKEKDQSFD